MLASPIPTDRASRWSLVAALIEEWFSGVSRPPQDGFAEADVVAAEERLGLRLPQALREWYLKCGRRRDVWTGQDTFVRPEELFLADDRLVIYIECQCVVQWGIDVAALGLADPPVVVFDPRNPVASHIASPTVSEFAIQMLALNAKFDDADLFRANGQVEGDAVLALEREFPRLPFADLHWPPFPTRLYGDERIIVEIDALTWIWITAREVSAFETAKRLTEAQGVRLEYDERPS